MAERSVRFYVVTNEHREFLPSLLPFDDMRDDVRALEDSDAYVKLDRVEVLGSAYDPSGSALGRRAVPVLALDRIEREVRLRIERRRNYRPLVLADDETLAEPTFYSLFGDNVLAVMRNNGQSPTSAAFRDYVNKLEILSAPIDVIPLADKDAVRALRDVQTLTRMRIAVGPEVGADAFSDSPYIADSIALARRRLGHVTVEIEIKVKASGHQSEAEAAFGELRNVIESGAIEIVDKAEMTYRRLEDGRARTFDFVDEAIVTQCPVTIDEDTAKPTEASAAEALAEAYDKMYDDIQYALNALR